MTTRTRPTTSEAVELLGDVVSYLQNVLDTVDEWDKGLTEVNGPLWARDMAERLQGAGFRSTGEGAEIVDPGLRFALGQPRRTS